MRTEFEAILHHSRPSSQKHHPMSLHDRAAQFAPFAALTGYDEEIGEAGRITDKRLFMDEERENYLNDSINRLEYGDEISVTYFQPDDKKQGGKYITVEGEFKHLEPVEGFIQLISGEKIFLSEIYDISERQVK